ncbi:MPND protein, partial [Quiscalus mexicanus]|nr:MPND protein [Quiscalus mexicanus]
GKKFVGDLGSDGTITWQETGQVFNSPSAWATHCKRLVNPAKKSGCGWASVRYKGQKLDQYKAAWLRQHQPNVPPPEEVGPGSPPPGTPRLRGTSWVPAPCGEGGGGGPGGGADPQGHHPEGPAPRRAPGAGQRRPVHLLPGKRLEVKPRVPVRYCTLGTRDSARNPQTLVEVTSFAAINKFQPFNVAISSNVLLLLDFHSHLTRSEVVGYLGGRWDTNTQLLTVLRAFPCRTRLGDAEAAGAVEEPFYHGNPGVESKIAPFWVMPPPEQRPNDYGIPMDVEVTYIQDGFLTNDVVQEMFYKGAPDLVKFQELWSQDQTYLDKLKGSLASRTPKDQSFSHVLEQIFSLLK